MVRLEVEVGIDREIDVDDREGSGRVRRWIG